MDSTLKQEANKLFSELGLDTATVMRIFLKTAVREKRLPL
ncbi:type II toxin-antitoxin system RelB/DinJ family antitoxin [uncultured Helicobacter sp.]